MYELMVYVLGYLFLQMSVVWFLYRRTHNPSIVDVTWSLGLMVSGLIYIGGQQLNPRLEVLVTLLMVWALRLALFLWFTRIRHRHIDKRYLQLSENWRISQALGYFLNFQLQGALIFIISTVFFFAAQVSITALTTVDYLGVVVVVVGIVGETLADWQLLQFKKNCKGRVCNQGLWHFSRHPNYFFEWLLWCGFSLFALQADYGYLGVISPAMLLFIFTRLTGPLTEEGSLRSRGQAYQEYQKRTNFFFPGWQKGP